MPTKTQKTREALFSLSANPQEALHTWADFLANKTQEEQETLNQAQFIWPLFGNSSFLSRFIARHPKAIFEVLASPYLKTVKSLEQCVQELEAIDTSDWQAWLKQVKIYKYRELLRITLKDLNGESQEKILLELSHLSISILRYVDAQVYQQSITRWGRPLNPEGDEVAYHILLLGKLGGYEINYSSDIDMIAFNETDAGKTEEGLSIHEFFVRHIQALTKTMQARDYEGFLYRVDWELRPEGKSGTLVNSLSAMESYYTSFGADWERQMLTKANVGAGNLDLGKEFISMMRPFIYRKYLDIKAIERILEMKQKVHNQLVKKQDTGFHVKLGIGGIREIEFYVQALLLVYAGKQKELRGTSTLDVLKKLRQAKLMGHSDALILKHAYLWLRKLEHRLQMIEESQTHTLPASDEDQMKAARRMGYHEENTDDALSRFKKDLQETCDSVHKIFLDLFSEHIFIDPSQPLKEGDIPYLNLLKTQLKESSDLEERIDELRYFKKLQIEKIQELESSSINKRQNILSKISKLAASTCVAALELAIEELKERFGVPIIKTQKDSSEESHILGIGMGKLGGMEINYASDLDMIFIYSENGETTGPKVITNREYFAKLVQKFIFILSIHTRYGRAYEIDTELRPSGHTGPLITSLERFIEYHRKEAQAWERQALLRAKPITGHSYLARLFNHQLDAILYSEPSPDEIRSEMNRLRMRIETELAKETESCFDFKKGLGGIMDIEFILQFIQLRLGHSLESLRVQNTNEGIDQIILHHPFSSGVDPSILKIAYGFYRTLESKIFLSQGRANTQLTYESTDHDEIAQSMKFNSWADFIKEYKFYSQEVRKFYLAVFEEGILKV